MKISSAGMPRQHSVGFLTGDELVLGCIVEPQSISSWEYLRYKLLQPWTPSVLTNFKNEALQEAKMVGINRTDALASLGLLLL